VSPACAKPKRLRFGEGRKDPLPAPCRLDGGDVDLFHLQHRGKRPLGLRPAVADDGVPVAVGLGLVFGGNLKREGLVVGERRPAVEAEAGDDA
jgi:hypothetical protein